MRTFKFRAWNVENKEMVYQEQLEGPGLPKYIFDIDCEGINLLEWDDEYTAYTHVESKIMQYTGSLDRNMKKIYEGDIVSYEDDLIKEKCKVVYEDGGFILKGENNISIPLSVNFEIEIIGNIFENLLKEE